MPLKIRVKPEGKIFAGGAILKNVGTHRADLLVLSDSPVLRDDYLMNMERKNDSDASNVYFLLQVIYLFKGKGQPLDGLVVETIKNFSKLYPKMVPITQEIITHLTEGNSFKALQVAHKLLAEEQGRPVPDLSKKTANDALTSSLHRGSPLVSSNALA